MCVFLYMFFSESQNKYFTNKVQGDLAADLLCQAASSGASTVDEKTHLYFCW